MADDVSATRHAFPPPNLLAAEESRAWIEVNSPPHGPSFAEALAEGADAPCLVEPIGKSLRMAGDDLSAEAACASLRSALADPSRILVSEEDGRGWWTAGFPHGDGFLLAAWVSRGADTRDLRGAFRGWSIFAAVDDRSGWDRETAAIRVERVVWSSQAEARRSAIDVESLAFIEATVVEDVRGLGSDEVWFHTVFLGPVVVQCSLASRTLAIDALMTPEEDEEDCVPLEAEVDGKAVVVPAALARTGGGKLH